MAQGLAGGRGASPPWVPSAGDLQWNQLPLNHRRDLSPQLTLGMWALLLFFKDSFIHLAGRDVTGEQSLAHKPGTLALDGIFSLEMSAAETITMA